jgi:hypothetical protein
MNRWILAGVLCGLCVAGCTTASNTNTQSSNQAVVTASPSASATPVVQSTNASNANTEKSGKSTQGDVTGAYFASGTLPNDFSEIDHLNLATIDEQAKPAPLNGFIRPKRKAAKDYKLVNPTLSGNNLTFSTIAVDGVSYSFTGAFEKMDDFAANPPPTDEVILKGTLTKMKDGKSVAETKVNFTYSAGG